MKHIVLFSGGAASSYVAWLVSQEQNKKDIILLHTPTYSEHPDADRFRTEVSNYLEIPITIHEDGRNIWELIDDNKCIPSNFIPFCTRILKLEQTEKFLRSIQEDYILYYGFGTNEWRRIQKSLARNEQLGRNVKFPLWEKRLSNESIREIIANEWMIELPITYKYLEHNNCLPCFKGGVRHFYLIWKYYPHYFWKASEKEEAIGQCH